LIITTGRLRLRCMEPRDIDDFVRDLNDWEVQQWLALPPFPYERKDGEAFLAIMHADHAGAHPTMFVMADLSSDAALGVVSVDRDDGDSATGVLGYWLGREHWGRGYMKEAAAATVRHARKHPALRRITSVTDPENARSQSILLACGFRDLGLENRPQPSRRGSMQMRRYDLVL